MYTVDCTLFFIFFSSRCLGASGIGFSDFSFFVAILYCCRDDIFTSFGNFYYI